MPSPAFHHPRIAGRTALAGALFLLAGCASVTPIGELLQNSSKYNGKEVRIKGEVKESAGLLGRGAYQVKDARTFQTLNIGGSGTTSVSFVVGV